MITINFYWLLLLLLIAVGIKAISIFPWEWINTHIKVILSSIACGISWICSAMYHNNLCMIFKEKMTLQTIDGPFVNGAWQGISPNYHIIYEAPYYESNVDFALFVIAIAFTISLIVDCIYILKIEKNNMSKENNG